MKKASGFKMKNPSIAKLAKAAGSPMRKDLPNYDEAWEAMKSYDTEMGNREEKKTKGGTVYSDDEKGYRQFVNDAKAYNEKKYGTTEPTKASREAGVSKKALAEGKKKVDAGTGSKLNKTDVSKMRLDGGEVKKPMSSAPKPKAKKKFKNTRLGKFLTTKRVKGAKKKTYNPRLNRFE